MRQVALVARRDGWRMASGCGGGGQSGPRPWCSLRSSWLMVEAEKAWATASFRAHPRCAHFLITHGLLYLRGRVMAVGARCNVPPMTIERLSTIERAPLDVHLKPAPPPEPSRFAGIARRARGRTRRCGPVAPAASACRCAPPNRGWNRRPASLACFLCAGEGLRREARSFPPPALP